MNNRKTLKQSRVSSLASCITVYLLLSVFVGHAGASNVDITATYKPDMNNSHAINFVNTTANSGYCSLSPSTCASDGIFSIGISNDTSSTPLVKDQGIALRVPFAWREVTVTASDGASRTVKIRIVGLGIRQNLNPDIYGIGSGSHGNLWYGGTWLYAPANCSGTNLAYSSSNGYLSFWRFNSENACVKTPKYNATPGVWFNGISFMYELQTPSPLTMNAGIYTGSTTYTLGPNGDFQFDNAIANDPSLTLNFTLTVTHDLRIQFPINADRLSLEAAGGWQQWLYNGPKYLPEKLVANQTFQQWSSGQFKVQLQCQYPIGSDCGIQNESTTTTVPVKTMITLPGGLQNSNNQPVNRYLLGNNSAAIFTPTRYINNERATLHFEVDKAGVGLMVNSGSHTFRGNVTVVWDSQI